MSVTKTQVPLLARVTATANLADAWERVRGKRAAGSDRFRLHANL